MSQTKVLLVSGDDFASTSFEQELDGDARKYFDLAEKNGGKYTVDGCAYFIEFQAFTFSQIPLEFVDLIHTHIQDYDHSKHTQFYIVPNN